MIRCIQRFYNRLLRLIMQTAFCPNFKALTASDTIVREVSRQEKFRDITADALCEHSTDMIG